MNDGRGGGERLPDDYGPYYKYDIYPKIPGIGRGSEQIWRLINVILSSKSINLRGYRCFYDS